MYRRDFVAAAAAVGAAGCVGSGRSVAPASDQRTPAGVQTAAAPPSSAMLAYGEWYEGASTNVTVTDASVESRLDSDGTASDEGLPPETKLVIVSGKLENTTDAQLALPDDVGASFGVVASDELFEPVSTAQSDGDGTAIDVSRIPAGDGTYLPTVETRLDPGEQLAVWQAVLVPSSLSTTGMQITMCTGDSDCAVRWEPAEKTCDCPG